MNQPDFILAISCPDRRGIVAEVTRFLFERSRPFLKEVAPHEVSQANAGQRCSQNQPVVGILGGDEM